MTVNEEWGNQDQNEEEDKLELGKEVGSKEAVVARTTDTLRCMTDYNFSASAGTELLCYCTN